MHVHSDVRGFDFDGDPAALFARLAAGRYDVLLFETADFDGESGARSFLFLDCAARIEARGAEAVLVPLGDQGPEVVAAVAEALAGRATVLRDSDRLTLTFPDVGVGPGRDRSRFHAASTAELLRVACFGWAADAAAGEPLRLPGVFAYDYVDRLEELPPAAADRHGFPDFVFWLPAVTVVVEHRSRRATLVVHSYSRAATACRDGAASDAAARALVEAIAESAEAGRDSTGAAGTAAAAGGPRVDADADVDDAEFAALVMRLQEHIRAGDVFQIVPSRSFRAPCPDPIGAYGELRRINPSPYMFFIRAPGFVLFGASPETFVDVRGTPRTVSIRPIAGTRPRGRTAGGAPDAELDRRLEAELMLDGKEIAEHMMLVDLARNDVARVSRPGTRRVSRLLAVTRCSHVMHLESAVEGELADGLDALDAHAAVTNMGTLVGAPKIEAARLLRRYEPEKRGPYGGAVGYLTSGGELHTAIVIRAALVRDGVAHVRAGAGVVFDSDPRAEAAETRAKATAVLEALRRNEGAGR